MKNCSNPKIVQAPKQAKQSGFSLMELMIVIVIIGVLVKIAMPAYTNSVQKSNRTDAKTALLDLATREEKYYSIANAYTASAPALYGGTTAAFPMNVQSGTTAYYTLSAPVPTAATSTQPAGFTAQAVPISGTSQANDPCGTLTINNTGVTGVLATASQTTGCW